MGWVGEGAIWNGKGLSEYFYVERYIKVRQGIGVASSTINRQLSVLNRMFRLGAQRHPPKVSRVPHIPMLREINVRTGFFEHGEYLALLEALPEYLKPVFTFEYHTGWRVTEITGLTWDKVDLHQGIVRLNPGETKTGQGRVLYLNQELLSVLHSKRELLIAPGYFIEMEDGSVSITRLGIVPVKR